MPAHQPILPASAIKLVESRDLDGAGALLADFAAAGLIKTYALVRETKPMGGPTETVRDSQIPAEEWDRIIASDKISSALNGGTVRLEGSLLEGGIPSVQITGISFSETLLIKILDRYCANSSGDVATPAPFPNPEATISGPSSASKTCEPEKKDVPPIRPGGLTASVAQAKQATGLGRTKLNALMRSGTLHSKKVGRRTLITVKGIERLAGVKRTQ